MITYRMGRNIFIVLWVLLLLAFLPACKHEPPVPVVSADAAHGFPEPVGNIIINKCATAGCHNAQSHSNAGGLLLDSWTHLFEGGSSGSVIVPYSIDYSSMLYFINTHADLGPMAEPRMPLDNAPLTRAEYITIRDWVANGTPDAQGNVPFATDAATRQKVYMLQQGCDLVAVVDARSKLVMRYIPVGKNYTTESPDCIALSPDGQFAYVCFWNGSYIQKIDTKTDKVIAEVDMGQAYFKSLHLSADGSRLAATSWQSQSLHILNTATMREEYALGGDLESPESIAANRAFDTFYVSSLFGNTVYKLAKGYRKAIAIDDKAAVTTATASTPDPYRIQLSPDGSRYFLSCQNSNEVRVMDAATDKLLAAIPTGEKPQEMAVCKSKPLLIVTCVGDTSSAGSIGAVYVINYQAQTVVKRIENRLYQPYGVAIDEQNGLFFISNRNQATKGPSPHHTSPCNGRNGYYMVYDLGTLEPVSNKRYEVSVDPYAAAIRFR